ncbi:MAG: hypothetical protein ACRCVT_03950, partial [Leadbetterella sp.]
MIKYKSLKISHFVNVIAFMFFVLPNLSFTESVSNTVFSNETNRNYFEKNKYNTISNNSKKAFSEIVNGFEVGLNVEKTEEKNKKTRDRRARKLIRLLTQLSAFKVDTLIKDSSDYYKEPVKEVEVPYNSSKEPVVKKNNSSEIDTNALLAFIFGGASLLGYIFIGPFASLLAIPSLIFAKKANKSSSNNKTMA